MSDPLDAFEKDPQAILDYTIDWSSWMAPGDSIAQSDWAADSADITLGLNISDDTTATVWVSGGTARRSYRLTNHIVTSSIPPREDDRSIILRIRDR